MRFIHLIVVAALVTAAADVYKIKFESTVQAERLAQLRVDIRRERDGIAALKAEWAQLDNPARIQALAHRHLTLKAIDPTQIEHLDRLPERPPMPITPPPEEAIATMIDTIEPDLPTGSTAAPGETAPGTRR
jgi:hypothetical protein